MHLPFRGYGACRGGQRLAKYLPPEQLWKAEILAVTPEEILFQSFQPQQGDE
ncbi:hypothetical protein HHA02_29940 [Cobetia marina]|nr:hypothetical protein HHA02_29940 [Cobetia marina]